MMNLVAIDITTSGFSPEVFGEIIAISACEFRDDGQVGAFFHSYISPVKGLDPLWERLLEVDNETLKLSPPLLQVAEQFFTFLDGRQIICTSYDMASRYLNDALAKLGRPHLAPSAFLSVWDLVPKRVFETSLEAIDEYLQIPPEAAYLPRQSSRRVAEMYCNARQNQGLRK